MCFLMVLDGQSQLQTSYFLSFSAAIFPTVQVHTLLLYLWPPGWTICVYCVVVEGRNCNCNLTTLYDLPSEATVLRWGSRKDGLGHTHDASGSDICVPIRTFFQALWGKPKQIFVVLKQCPAANKLLQAFVWIWLIHTYLIYLSYLISFSQFHFPLLFYQLWFVPKILSSTLSSLFFSFRTFSTCLHMACAIPFRSSPRREKRTQTKTLLRVVVVCVVSANCCNPRLLFLCYLFRCHCG